MTRPSYSEWREISPRMLKLPAFSRADGAPFVIAELSGNHNGSLQRAKELIHAAHECGADAVKLQTYTAEDLATPYRKDHSLVRSGLWAGSYLYDLYKLGETPREWHAELFDLAKSLGMMGFSTPFSVDAVEFLDSIGAPAFKVASMENCNEPLIDAIVETGKPVLVSTGKTPWSVPLEGQQNFVPNVPEAWWHLRHVPKDKKALLYCIAEYPADKYKPNWVKIDRIRRLSGGAFGWSDHYTHNGWVATMLCHGASIIEKHLTLDKTDGALDSQFSLDPKGFAELVRICREWNQAPVEDDSSVSYRRTCVATKPIKEGDRIDDTNTTWVRVVDQPINAPRHWSWTFGKKSPLDYEPGDIVCVRLQHYKPQKERMKIAEMVAPDRYKDKPWLKED